MSRLRTVLILVIVGFCLLLSVQQQRISDLQKQQTTSAATAFRQQLNPGFACGVLTTSEAANFLGQQDILSSGTIIPADSPTAAVRLGSPRLDSCSYSADLNNVSYIDIVIKRYDTNDVAKSAFVKETQGVLGAEKGDLNTDTTTDVYSSGVHYLLRNNFMYEISASKPGAATGVELEAFSDSVASFVVNKL